MKYPELPKKFSIEELHVLSYTDELLNIVLPIYNFLSDILSKGYKIIGSNKFEKLEKNVKYVCRLSNSNNIVLTSHQHSVHMPATILTGDISIEDFINDQKLQLNQKITKSLRESMDRVDNCIEYLTKTLNLNNLKNG